MATAMLSDFELTRQKRIEDNQRRMAEMGISAMAAHILRRAEPVPAPPVRPPTPWPTSRGTVARCVFPPARVVLARIGLIQLSGGFTPCVNLREVDPLARWIFATIGGRRVANFAARCSPKARGKGGWLASLRLVPSRECPGQPAPGGERESETPDWINGSVVPLVEAARMRCPDRPGALSGVSFFPRT